MKKRANETRACLIPVGSSVLLYHGWRPTITETALAAVRSRLRRRMVHGRCCPGRVCDSEHGQIIWYFEMESLAQREIRISSEVPRLRRLARFWQVPFA